MKEQQIIFEVAIIARFHEDDNMTLTIIMGRKDT